MIPLACKEIESGVAKNAEFNFKGTEYTSSDVGVEDLEDDPRDVRIASLVASQTGTTARVQQQIGWLCGEPMPDYAHVVYKSVR